MKPGGVIAAVLAWICLGTAGAATSWEDPVSTSLRISCPLYLMEYHLWYESPFGSTPDIRPRKWPALEEPDISSKAPWKRPNKTTYGYPLLGYYSSSNREIVRWQLACMKAAGIDGVFVQLFPDKTGIHFEKEDVFEIVLDEAGKAGIKIACHDEAQFRQGWTAQDPAIMAERVTTFLGKYANHPAYLHVDKKPAYAFQFWDHFQSSWNADSLNTLLSTTARDPEKNPYWIIYNGSDKNLYQDTRVPAHVVAANSNFIKPSDGSPEDVKIDWSGLWLRLIQLDRMKASYPAKSLALWAYPGFRDRKNKGFPRNNADGNVLRQTLESYNAHKPDFIMISSWNDWLENSAIEPGYYDDTLSNDPYYYCRLLAHLKGKMFIAPPLPSTNVLDPLLRDHLKELTP